jgi:hypothetical protein
VKTANSEDCVGYIGDGASEDAGLLAILCFPHPKSVFEAVFTGFGTNSSYKYLH